MAIGVTYFDIGQTLGTPQLTPAMKLERLDVFPYIPAILRELSGQGVRLGIISNTGDETADKINAVIKDSGLYNYFDQDLLIYSSQVGQKKNSPEIFELAAQAAGQSPGSCLFVGEDARERGFAAQAGMLVCPHPLLASDVVKGDTVHYARLTAPDDADPAAWRSLLRDLDVVPVHVAGPKGDILYAILSGRMARDVFNAQFTVQLLGKAGQPQTSELYLLHLLRDDKAKRTGFMSIDGQAQTFFECSADPEWVLASSPDGILVALPGDRLVEEWHFADAEHGHNLKLMPNPLLLRPFGTGPNEMANL
jgi:leucyl aminopeptidase